MTYRKSALEYPVIVSPLPEEEGGGFAATVPDLPGCMSDGETPQEAVSNVVDAIAAWIEAAHELGREIPPPSVHKAFA
ncbi:MAG: type II toxin-antitoxin system HicB family antitoxin [Shinella sp.]|nr:type II toxin-antitoxin system HicB family antitoxin [Shinella sp.]